MSNIDDRIELQDTVEHAEMAIIVFIVAVNLVALISVSVSKIVLHCKRIKLKR